MTALPPFLPVLAGGHSARRHRPFEVVSLKFIHTAPPLNAASSCDTIRRKLNSSKNPWTASKPPLVVTRNIP